MTDAQQREAARQFFYKWNGKGKEDEDARSYWIDILVNIFGMENMTDRVEFEKKVIGGDGNTKRIDVYIPETQVLIEQKSLGIALDKPQAGHDGMTPYEQAKMYDNYLPFDDRARWIVTSNFGEIWIYDRNKARPEPVKIALADLPTKYHMLDFLVRKEVKHVSDEMKISLQAGELVGKIYDAFLKQYRDTDKEEALRSLNKLCVRIVFCLYAEDADVFGKKNMFHDYMAQFNATQARIGLRNLFRVLNQKPEDRDKYLADDDPLLAAFPYVNGGLFDGDDITIPPFTDEIMDLLLRKASDDFDWSEISPTIFGAVFESTLNPETRRSGGMHYTSIDNIHKVIDPLFLDDLKAELEEIKGIAVWKDQEKRLKAFQEKLAATVLLDPAAGSGNFLTESYLSIRRLENEVISLLQHGQVIMGAVENPIKVNISQLYGIEINDFAVTVARTALWIAENQMMKETEEIVHMSLDFLPLKTAAHIVEGNALRIDWEDVVQKEKLSFIIGNPPFVGYAYQSTSQKEDLRPLYPDEKNIDYVAGWYMKAAEFMSISQIRTAFVSTNSITQGEQVVSVWKSIIEKHKIHLDFAYRTFIWDSEASLKAHVHCVIIGFSSDQERVQKYLFDENGNAALVQHISPYLIDSDDVFISKRSAPLSQVPPMHRGSQPTDDGNFILSDEEKNALLSENPELKAVIREYMMGKDFIHRAPRYCLWLADANPSLIKSSREIVNRVERIREFREKSSKASTREKANTPTLFDENQQPETDFVAIPKVSSQRRRYVPMDFMHPDTVVGDKIYIVENATLYHFGVLTSNVHMAWMRAICGRLKSDYSYSNTIVYNNFIWPEPTAEQRHKISETAQEILNVRANYPDTSFSDLYDPDFMPDSLQKAHRANDIAVMKAYGMPIKETNEAACVAWLMKLYQELISKKESHD